MIEVYVDGACSGNPGPGGYAYCVVKGNNILHQDAGYLEQTTNNICELLALLYGIDYALFKFPNEEIRVYCDSAYCVNGFNEWIHTWKNNGFINSKKEEVKNKDLWLKLLPYTNNKNLKVLKVKGHSGNSLNSHVDRMAVDAYKNRY